MANSTVNLHENYKPSIGPIQDVQNLTLNLTPKGTMAAIVNGKAVRAASQRRVAYVVSTYVDPNDSAKSYARLDLGGCSVRGILSGADYSVVNPTVGVVVTDNQTFEANVYSGVTVAGRVTQLDTDSGGPNVDLNKVWVELAPYGS